MSDNSPLFLVTGANGWLGKGLIKAISSGLPEIPQLKEPLPGLKIRALVHPNDIIDDFLSFNQSIEIIRGDITVPDSLYSFFKDSAGATLFHCAGIIHPARASQFYEVNTKGSVNIWNLSAAAGLRRIVMMSSNSPCGNNPHPDHLFDEKSPYNPYMGYGRSKMLMERAILELAGKKSGPETVIVRAPWFYGPFQPPRQTEFFLMIRDGKGPLLGRGNNRRSMTYIDNLSQGLILASRVPAASGQIYWIADRRPYSMAEIIEAIENILENDFGIPCRHKRLRLPSIAADVAMLFDFSLQKLGLYHQKIHVLSEMNKTIACSIKKAEDELGYDPKIDIHEGMRRSISWLLESDQNKQIFLSKSGS